MAQRALLVATTQHAAVAQTLSHVRVRVAAVESRRAGKFYLPLGNSRHALPAPPPPPLPLHRHTKIAVGGEESLARDL